MAAPNPLTYNGLIAQVCLLAPYQYSTVSGVVTPQQAEFTALIPQMLNYAEQRIQRDLELMATNVARSGYALTQVEPTRLVVGDVAPMEVSFVNTPQAQPPSPPDPAIRPRSSTPPRTSTSPRAASSTAPASTTTSSAPPRRKCSSSAAWPIA